MKYMIMTTILTAEVGRLSLKEIMMRVGRILPDWTNLVKYGMIQFKLVKIIIQSRPLGKRDWTKYTITIMILTAEEVRISVIGNGLIANYAEEVEMSLTLAGVGRGYIHQT